MKILLKLYIKINTSKVVILKMKLYLKLLFNNKMSKSCLICKKKINKIYILIHTCRCNGIYCNDHLHNHHCSFDYKTEYQENMKKEMPVITKQKVIKC